MPKLNEKIPDTTPDGKKMATETLLLVVVCSVQVEPKYKDWKLNGLIVSEADFWNDFWSVELPIISETVHNFFKGGESGSTSDSWSFTTQ